MKPIYILYLAGASLLLTLDSYAQSFVNRGFETTTITPVIFPGGTRYTATLPGWTWSPPGNAVDEDPSSAGYNDIALSGPAVTMQGTDSLFAPAIRGSYSILLQGGSQSAPSSSFSAIWQTGQIPVDAVSLIYWGGALQVTFNGQSLTPVATGNGASYTIWGMDISAYSGQTGELRFTKPWLSGGALLDNIQFSSVAVPEPTVLALCGVSLPLLLAARLMKRPNKSLQPTGAALSD